MNINEHVIIILGSSHDHLTTKQRALKIVNISLNTIIYPYFETSGGKSSILYLNVVDFFNTSVN